MKIIFICLILVSFLSCSREVPFKENKAAENCKAASENIETSQKKSPNVKSDDITVVDWGPQSTKLGINPNRQADGGLGLWVRISSSSDRLNGASVIFDGKAALVTTIDGSLITASVSVEQLSTPGVKNVFIQLSENKTVINIGKFIVEPM